MSTDIQIWLIEIPYDNKLKQKFSVISLEIFWYIYAWIILLKTRN